MSDKRMNKIGVAAALVAAMCLTSGPASASNPDPASVKPVQELATNGAKEFSAGNSTKAVELLQQAIGLIQKSIISSLSNFLPKPPAGWEAGKVGEQSMSAGGQGLSQHYRASRRYTKEVEKIKVTVNINASGALAEESGSQWRKMTPQVLAALNRNPERQTKKIERDGGWKGIITVDKNGRKAEAAAILSIPGGLLTVEVNPDREDILDQFLGMIDFAGLAKSLGGMPSANP